MRLFARFLRDRDGNIAIMFAYTFILLSRAERRILAVAPLAVREIEVLFGEGHEVESLGVAGVARLERRVAHPMYGKVVTRTKKYHAHDETNECKEGDVVTIEECRPLSRTKTWRVTKLVERAKVI